MNLYGHKYFGPGNPSDRGDPVDKDDKIAKQHDIEYDKAATVCDVREADKKAIALFWLDSMINRNWHSSLGFLGIGFKFITETFTGVLYPPNVNKDCTCNKAENETSPSVEQK